MCSSRIFYRLLLVFSLLFVQTGGMVHGIAHTLAEQTQDQSLPHDKLCELCAAYAQIGGALASNAFIFIPAAHAASFVASLLVSVHSPAFSAFAARAPPYFI